MKKTKYLLSFNNLSIITNYRATLTPGGVDCAAPAHSELNCQFVVVVIKNRASCNKCISEMGG